MTAHSHPSLDAMAADTPPPGPDGGTGDRRDRDHDRLTIPGGLAALSLDALASVAYGPEAVVLVLVAAGAHGLGSPSRSRWPSPRCWPS